MNHIELKVNGIRIARDVKDNVRLINYHSDTHALVLIISGDLICFLFFNRPLFLDTPHITQPEITLYL